MQWATSALHYQIFPPSLFKLTYFDICFLSNLYVDIPVGGLDSDWSYAGLDSGGVSVQRLYVNRPRVSICTEGQALHTIKGDALKWN